MGLLLAIDRRIADNVADLRARPLGQEGLQQGRRAARLDDGHHRPRLDRAGRRRAGGGVRHHRAGAGQARPCVAHSRRAPRSSGITHAGLAARAAGHLRHRLPARAVRRRRPSTWWTTTFLGQMKHGRDPAQHLARRRRRRGGTAEGARRRRRSGPVSTCSPTSPRSGTAEWKSALAQHPQRRRHPPHRRLDPAGPARDRRRGRGDHRRVRGRRGAQLRQPRTRAGSASVDPDRPPPRPGRRARPGARPAEHGRPQRRAHGEPRLPRRRGGGRVDRRGRDPCPTGCWPTSARSRTCSGCPRRRSADAE